MAHDEATGWFEPLYANASAGRGEVPWDDGQANPDLARVLGDGDGAPAVVVGCGLGDDADLVASRGWATTAFDVAPTALRMARERFPQSQADFVLGDLLDLPTAWIGAFDLVVEHYTVQALPVAIRAVATAAVRSLVAPGGRLIVLAMTTEDGSADRPGPPWRMTQAEIEAFAADGLTVERSDVVDAGEGILAELTRTG